MILWPHTPAYCNIIAACYSKYNLPVDCWPVFGNGSASISNLMECFCPLALTTMSAGCTWTVDVTGIWNKSCGSPICTCLSCCCCCCIWSWTPWWCRWMSMSWSWWWWWWWWCCMSMWSGTGSAYPIISPGCWNANSGWCCWCAGGDPGLVWWWYSLNIIDSSNAPSSMTMAPGENPPAVIVIGSGLSVVYIIIAVITGSRSHAHARVATMRDGRRRRRRRSSASGGAGGGGGTVNFCWLSTIEAAAAVATTTTGRIIGPNIIILNKLRLRAI